MGKYKVIVKATDSKCPHIREGDKFVIEGTMLNFKETNALCTVALSSMNYSLYMMSHADDPKSFGRDNIYCLHCPDPEARVIFEISRERLE